MIRLEVIFLMQCMLGIFMIIFLHKLNRMKKQVDNITKEVKEYLAFIEADIQEDSLSAKTVRMEKKAKISKDEEENHLIQSVLQEYFP